MSRLPLAALAMALLASPGLAAAEYADPPDGPVIVDPAPVYEAPPYDPHPVVYSHSSTLRVMTGPAARIWDTAPAAGLFVGVEAGRGAAGARASAAWIDVGHPRGTSQYTGEIWVAFDVSRLRLRPSIAAGGGLAQLELWDSTETTQQTTNVGIGVLRGGLVYRLPVRSTDARLGLDVSAVVPAIRDPRAPEVQGWLIGAASVAVGF